MRLLFDVLENPVLISPAFAQTAPAAAAGGTESALMSMLPLILMFVVLYFLMIRPQMKRQKETKAMIDALQKGDEVVTIGGVLGKIEKIGEGYISLSVEQGSMQVERAAVSRVLPKGTIK
jgi:preprotein translocase subunit YajC